MAGRSKKQNQRSHAKRRAFERYGLFLNKESHKELVRQIQSEKATFVKRQSCRISQWIVEYQGSQIPVIYDKTRHVIVTVLSSKSKTVPV